MANNFSLEFFIEQFLIHLSREFFQLCRERLNELLYKADALEERIRLDLEGAGVVAGVVCLATGAEVVSLPPENCVSISRWPAVR